MLAILKQHTPSVIAMLIDAYCGPNVFEGHSQLVRSLAVSSDNQYLFSGSEDDTIRQWAINTGETVRILKGHSDYVISLAISSDNKYLFSGSWDSTIRQWAIGNEPVGSSIETGETVRTLQEHFDAVISLVISSDNKYLFSGSWDKTIRQWAIETGESVRTLQGHSDAVLSLAISPGNKYLFSGSYDSPIRQWPINHISGFSEPIKVPLLAGACVIKISHDSLFYTDGEEINQWRWKPFRDTTDCF